MTQFKKYLAVLIAVLHGIFMLIARPILQRIDTHVYDVDNVLSGFTKLQNKLDRAAQKALARGDACVEAADALNKQADNAYAAADRAEGVKMRLNKLLD
jgi:hypothetical protein